MAAKAKTFDYATKAAELEAVLTKLQASDTSLDDAMKLHQQGLQLIAELEDYLKHAENEVKTRVTKQGS